jgi:hypothetical protein
MEEHFFSFSRLYRSLKTTGKLPFKKGDFQGFPYNILGKNNSQQFFNHTDVNELKSERKILSTTQIKKRKY